MDDQISVSGTAVATMALDLVEPWDHPEEEVRENSKKLPEGITSRMMYRDVIHIAWPSMVELALTQLTAMVDLMMVGQLGPWALSAVGLTTQPKFLLMTLFIALNVGATAMVARSKGEGNQEKANLFLRQSIVMSLVFGVAMSIVGFYSSEALIRFMGGGTDLHVLEAGTAYLKIQCIGALPLALSTVVTATLRGVGNSRTAMVYNITANVVNVILNYILIYGHFGFPRMEVAGASLATVLGQFVAFLLAFRAITSGKNYLHLRFRDGFRPDRKAIGSIVGIGLPAMLEQLVMRIGIIIYTRTVAGLGTIAYATHQVCMNINSMSFMIGQAVAVSATSLVGQSLGRRRPDMARHYTGRCGRLGLVVSVTLGVIFFFFGGAIIALYNDEPELIALGTSILRMIAFILPFQSSQFILAGALRGAGDTKVIAAISFITVLLVRPGLTIFAVNVLHAGLFGAWIILGFDQLLRTSLVALRYRSGKWKSIQV